MNAASKFNIFFKNIKDKIVASFKNINSMFYYFLLLIVVGLLFFASSLATEHFTTPFTGDYCAQQYAFYLNAYDDWKVFFTTGSFKYFDMNTYLGVNNIGSNSFYSVVDPFFFFVMLFPRSFIAQAMAISTILRMSCAGLLFYYYLRYMGVKDISARIAGLAYAYCGWTTWFLWFNNFTENAFTFVLILMGVEVTLRKKKPWLLAFALFFQGLTNFFFLISFTMMAFIYAMWRYFQRLKLNTWKDNLIIISLGFMGFLIGLFMSAVVLLPSIYVALDTPRVTSANYIQSIKEFLQAKNFKQVFDYIFSWKNVDSNNAMREHYPIIEFFYPAMSDRGTPLTKYGNETYDNVAGSTFSYYIFIIMLIPAIIRSCKKKNFWPLVALVFFVVSLYSPFMYYLFFGFTKPYSRWTIFVTTSLLTYVAGFLDHMEEEPVWEYIVGGLFTVTGVIAGAVLASYIINQSVLFVERVSIVAAALIASAYVIGITVVVCIYLKRKWLKQVLSVTVVVEAIVMGLLTIEGHGVSEFETINYSWAKNEALHTVVEKVNKDEKGNYFRALSSLEADGNRNDGMRNNYNGAGFFHSEYNFYTTDFTYWSMLFTGKTGWSGRYVEKREALDKFLGLKYYFIEKDRTQIASYGLEGNNYYYASPNVPHGFMDVSNEYENNDFFVYRDEEHVDFAFSYDTIYAYDKDGKTPMESLSGSDYSSNAWLATRDEELYLDGGIISEEDTQKVLEEAGEDVVLKDIPYYYHPDLLQTTIYSSGLPSSSIERKYYKMNQVARNMKIEQILMTLDLKSPEDASTVKNNEDLKTVIVYEPKAGKEFPYDSEGMTFYIDATFIQNTKEDIYFISDDNKVITWDRHNDDRTTDSSNRRGPRGFYVRKDPETGVAPKVSKIVIIPRWSGLNARDTIKYYFYKDFKAKYLDEIQANPVENVTYRDNYFGFTTNYAKKRFICTQVAFDPGWTVEVKNDNKWEKLSTYKSQGGFVGFLSEAGKKEYRMTYFPTYLKEGRLLFGIGTFIYVTTYIGYLYIDDRNQKKKREALLNLRYQ